MERSERGAPGRRAGRTALAAALACVAAQAIAAPGPDDGGGTYRMQGVARVDAVAPLGRSLEARGDAVVRPEGSTVRLRLAGEGEVCELVAARAADGALALAPGQRCAFDLDGPDARGHVEARLREGRGTLRDRRLALDLAFDLSGAVALRTAERVQVLGMELPATWTPDLPLNGGASVRAEGTRDESRAAQPR